MSRLTWFSLSLPRDMELPDVTAVLRPLAARPRIGITGAVALAVIEVWSIGGRVSWRLGLDFRIAQSLSQQMAAHLPRLGMRQEHETERPALSMAAEVRMHGLASPLRLETAGAVASGMLAVLGGLAASETGVVQWLIGPGRTRPYPPAPLDFAEVLGLHAAQSPDGTALRLWRQKVTEPLFGCRGRIAADGPTRTRAAAIVRSLGNALALADTAHAGLRRGRASARYARRVTNAGRTPLTWSCLLSAAELATVIGWPLKETPSEELALTGGHINEAPQRLLVEDGKEAGEPRRVLGESLHAAQRGQLVTMPVNTALHHVQVAGPTGSGKSTLLASMILADIAAGRSVLVVEPRGDLVNDVLARVLHDRRDRVVVIDPASSDRAVGVNVLAGDRADAERQADEVVHLLAELHGGNLGPRSTDVLLHALITAARLPDGTLCDVPALLANPAFRRQALAQVTDPLVLGPWWAGFEALSEPERGRYIAPLLNKLRPIISRSHLRRMFSQSAPKFGMDELFTTPGTVALVNLSRGLIGTPAANMLGALILSQTWTAIQRRASLPPEKRQPVSVVVDEFQDFLRLPGGVDFGDALAQSRGLGVSWTLAHQHLDQLSSTQQAGVLANARSRIVFRPSPGDAKPLAAALGGEVTADDLLSLRAYQACVALHLDGQPTRPFSITTRPLPSWTSDPAKLRQASAYRFGVDGEELDKALTERRQGAHGSTDAPVGFKRRAAK
ncbi:type IV secretory system conjugative DNA transfer family protein [Micromonospora sp. NBC_01796]|uniref:type IV secretory system conjugative DNA transfer family protein n=1 Tax=Micromonospora sp. NBC_01796 TaxID=2975987 RepID=UPI002DDB3A3E|nr:hypothetical protein [Micromonospora sp. NBC_01796]WSA86713.1 hypothetical protein OIE47_03545 [Micromonospora sp. NBC_01796]